MSDQNRPAMHAGQAVVEALKAEGVEKIFCVPGSHIHQFYDALREEPSIRLITCKQEPNASLMADAYGRLTGKVGVCLLTAGPGGINSLAGVAQAYGAASPMIHLSGAVPIDGDREAFHGVDDPEFVAKCYQLATKWSARVKKIEDIPSVMARAFRLARSGRTGPVHVEIPRLTDQSPYLLQSKPAVLEPYRAEPADVLPPSPKDIDRIARRLLEAKSPVLCAGKGVIRKGAMQELSDLSLKLSIPIVYSQDAIGVVAEDHPFSTGQLHYRPHPLFLRVMKNADLLLSVGLRPQSVHITQLKDYLPKTHILVGFDDTRDNAYTGDDQIVADPKLFLRALLERLQGESRPSNEELKMDIARSKAKLKEHILAQVKNFRSAKPIHPGFLMATLAPLLAPDVMIASDVGNCQMWGRQYLQVKNPESFMQSGVWNAMSFSLPTAIVAKMEFPNRQVVGLAGDGAFLMIMGDFVTACELKTNIVMVILNDGSYGQFYLQQKNLYEKTYCTDFKTPNFAEIAQACGGLGIRVEDPAKLEGALKTALAADRPAIVDVVIGIYPYVSLDGVLDR